MKTILVDAVNTLMIQNTKGDYEVFWELLNLLEIYSNLKIIVTNANDEQMTQFGLSHAPYPVFTMKHVPDKPDPIYFRTLLEQYNLSTRDVVYFEHNPEALRSAESLGIIGYYYDKDRRDLVSLKQFLDIHLH